MLHKIKQSLFRTDLEKWPIKLKDLARSSVYIYGAGQLGIELAIICEEMSIEVKGFLDRASHGSTLWPNIPVLKVEALSQFKNELVLVTVVKDRDALLKQLRKDFGALVFI